MSSADRPHKKITHSSSTSNDDPVQVSQFSPKLPTNQSNSEERPSKGLFPSYFDCFNHFRILYIYSEKSY